MADLHDLAPAYSLDALDPSEIVEFEDHLRSCQRCQEEVANLREGAAVMAEGLSTPPPPEVKERVLQTIGVSDAPVTAIESRRRPSTWLAAAAAVLLVGFGLWAVTERGLEGSELIEAVQNAPDAVATEVETGHGPLRFTYSASLGSGVLDGGELVDLAVDELYQLWRIEGDGPESAGTFHGGNNAVLVEGLQPGATLAMTVESAPGSDQPTADPVFTLPV